MKNTILVVFTGLLIGLNLHAQDTEKVSVPLSNSSDRGSLKIYNHDGTIEIIGYNGNTVEVEFYAKGNKNKNKDKGNRKGLRQIPNNAKGVTITEEDNHVEIGSSNNDQKNYRIKVPKNFDLIVSAHHHADITISDVVGELEINSHHGWIEMNNVGGSVIADTHHGDITVSLTEITSNEPMAFTTYHGDVDITFPEDLNADVKMKSAKGDIYTDFDFAVKRPKLEESRSGNRNEIKTSGWTYGVIGSGGAEIMFDTYHGDVILRKE